MNEFKYMNNIYVKFSKVLKDILNFNPRKLDYWCLLTFTKEHIHGRQSFTRILCAR